MSFPWGIKSGCVSISEPLQLNSRSISVQKKHVPSYCRPSQRTGAVMVEVAVVLSVTLVVLFTMLDLALAVARYNCLSDCARRVARAVIVRGEMSSVPLGPIEWNGTASDSYPPSQAISGMLTTMRAEDVAMRVTWPDGENKPGQRVHIDLSYQHVPVLGAIFSPWELTASSTMVIVH